MSQKRTTELVARITGEIRDAEAKLSVVKRQITELGETGERANRRLALASTSATAANERAGAQFAKTTEKMARGVAAVTTALYALEAEGSARVLAIGGAVGNLAEFMGPTGKLVSGAAIVASSIVALFMQAKEKSAEATKAMQDDLQRLVDAANPQGVLDETERTWSLLGDAKARAKAIEEEKRAIETGERVFAKYADRQRAVRAVTEALEKEGETIAKLELRYKTFSKAAQEGTAAERTHSRGLSGATVTTKGDTPDKMAKDAKKASEALNEVRKALRDVYDTFNKPDAYTQAKKAIDDWADRARKAKVPTKEIEREVRDLWHAFAVSEQMNGERALKAFQEALDDRHIAIRQSLTDEMERQRIESRSIKQSEQGIQQLEKEAELLKQGTQVADEYVRAQQRAAAIEAAREVERQRNGSNETSIAIAGNLAARLFDAQQKVTDIRLQLQRTDASRLAGTFAEVAQSATQIATSLGDAGKNLAQVAAIAGPLLSGLDSVQGALQKRDNKGQIVKGQSVGLLDAILGRNGAESRAQALAGTLQVVSAGVMIADQVFDIFGTQSRRKIEEMRKAAAEFRRALEDFAAAANPKTGAAAAIRDAQRQALELAKQAAAAGGGTLKFEGSQVDANTLREWQREIENARAALSKLPPQLREQLATTAKGFGDIATSLDELQEAARKQVLANIEDLGVRRLIAAGMPEAAEQLRKQIELNRELAAARADDTAIGEDYARALEAIQLAEQLAAEASRRRAAIMQQIDDDDAILGGDANQRLQRRRVAMRSLFGGDVADQFEGLDFGTEAGLKAARAIVEQIYRGMMSDGVIDELERPLLDWLKTMVGDVDNALSSLPEVLDPLAAKLEAFNVRISTFALSAAEQFEQLRQIFADDSAITSLVGGVDLGTEGARSALKSRIEGEIAAILADNDISETERPYLDALQQFLGIVNSAIDAATRALEEEAARAKAARDEQRQWAQNRIALFGLEGVNALEAQMQSFGAVFTELFKQFDPSSLAGLEAAQSHLRAIYDELVGMTDEEVMQRFGMTRDEVVAAVLSTNNSLGTLVTSLQQTEEAAAAAARATAEFTDRVYTDYLRSSGRDKEADLRAAQKRRDDDLAEAAERGAGQDAIDWILKTYDNIVRQIEERYAAKVAEVQQAAVSGGGSGGVSSSGAESATRPKARNTTVVGDFMTASELTAQSMAGLLNDIRYNTGREGAIADLLRSLGSGPSLSAMTFPAFPTRAAASGGGTVVFRVDQINLTVGALNPEGMTAAEAGRALIDAVSREMGRRAGDEAAFRGSAKYGGLR